MTKIATSPAESAVFYPVTGSERESFDAWLEQEIALDDHAAWLRGKIQSQKQPGVVLGIAGCSLIFPTISDRSEISLEEVEAAISKRLGRTVDQMVAAEPQLGANSHRRSLAHFSQDFWRRPMLSPSFVLDTPWPSVRFAMVHGAEREDVLGTWTGMASPSARQGGEGSTFVPWQYLPPLLFVRKVMQKFGIEKVRLVESSNVSGASFFRFFRVCFPLLSCVFPCVSRECLFTCSSSFGRAAPGPGVLPILA